MSSGSTSVAEDIRDVAVQPTLLKEAASENRAGGSRIEAYLYEEDEDVLVRRVRLRSGEAVESLLPADLVSDAARSLSAAYDQAWLRSDYEPTRMERRGRVEVMDLFSGCGGMTLGVVEAGRALGLDVEPRLAVDLDQEALDVYGANFPDAELRDRPVEEILDGDPGAEPTESEQEFVEEFSGLDVVLGGPPCQGSSDLNNHTRRADPKNALFLRMARAAEVLRPRHVIIENVLGIRHDTNSVYQRTREHLRSLGYAVGETVLRAEELGVAQRRHRVFLVASEKDDVDLEQMIAPLRYEERPFRWACGDLVGEEQDGNGFDAASTPAEVTRERIDHLFDEGIHNLPDEMRPPCHRDGDHNYPSVYGRMWEDEPAPTITTGFTAMGQGRFVHPTRRRTITPHEAARLQFFPDFFDFGDRSRAAYKTLIGNAVPPKLTYVLALQLLR